MILRQLFEHESFTYTYLIADEGEACLIDPVLEHVDSYLRLLKELELSLKFSIETHVHADHVTASGKLRKLLSCQTLVGESQVTCASDQITDGMSISIGKVELKAIYTPGHTDNSYSFLLPTPCINYLFTGDTLLIRGTGRTDFQNGNPEDLYNSLNKLLEFSDDTIVYPGHDYKGWTISTIGEEKAHNPRLQCESKEEFIDLMNNLKLPNPKLMDLAVPANLKCGEKS